MKIYKSLSITLLLACSASATALAQSYYDDDIYYDSSKEAKKAPEAVKKQQNATGNGAQYQGASSQYKYLTATDGSVYVVDEQGNAYPVMAQNIPGSDLYTVYTDNTRDVDEYNRRYQQADTISADSLYRDTFANTRKIERFSNPTIVSQSNDQELIDYYAATQPAQINVFVETPSYYGWSYLSPYYRPYGYWNSWAWDPWYGPGWYDPYYAWSWGWGQSWGWGPSWSWSWTWGPGWYPGHGRPHPPVSPGAHRPAYPGSNMAHSTGGYRGNSSGRPGGSAGTGGYRGSAGSRPSTVGNVNSLGTTRPATNYNNGSRPSGSRYNNGTRNSNVNSGSNRSGGRGNAVNNTNNNSRPSTPSYRSSGSTGGSRGGFSGGSRGGGGSRSGGGGGRGGRR